MEDDWNQYAHPSDYPGLSKGFRIVFWGLIPYAIRVNYFGNPLLDVPTAFITALVSIIGIVCLSKVDVSERWKDCSEYAKTALIALFMLLPLSLLFPYAHILRVFAIIDWIVFSIFLLYFCKLIAEMGEVFGDLRLAKLARVCQLGIWVLYLIPGMAHSAYCAFFSPFYDPESDAYLQFDKWREIDMGLLVASYFLTMLPYVSMIVLARRATRIRRTHAAR